MIETPPCNGLSRLFDSTELADHKRAAAICAVCPMIDACRQQLAVARATATKRGGRGSDVGPVGTWAGQRVGFRPRRKLPPIEHGTPKGAWTHRNRKNSPICAECREAEKVHLAKMRAEKKGAAA